jgi:hypothetical protein
MTTTTLFCEAGQHNWERESQRGRKPFNCPEHASAAPKVKLQAVRAEGEPQRAIRPERQRKTRESRVSIVETILANRPEHCHCDIRPDMTHAELIYVKSCTPYWVCPTLDKVRRLSPNAPLTNEVEYDMLAA